MTEGKPKSNILMIVLATMLIFIGPTYIVYALTNILNLNYILSMISGFALFIVGLVFLLFLVKRKVIS